MMVSVRAMRGERSEDMRYDKQHIFRVELKNF